MAKPVNLEEINDTTSIVLLILIYSGISVFSVVKILVTTYSKGHLDLYIVATDYGKFQILSAFIVKKEGLFSLFT